METNTTHDHGPEQLLGGEGGGVGLVRGRGAAAEGVADGEDAEAAEGVQREEDEDGEGHEAVHDLPLQPPQVQLRDRDVGVQVRHPARELPANLAVFIEKF